MFVRDFQKLNFCFSCF